MSIIKEYVVNILFGNIGMLFFLLPFCKDFYYEQRAMIFVLQERTWTMKAKILNKIEKFTSNQLCDAGQVLYMSLTLHFSSAEYK